MDTLPKIAESNTNQQRKKKRTNMRGTRTCFSKAKKGEKKRPPEKQKQTLIASVKHLYVSRISTKN